MTRYYKATRPDGTDFQTCTIRYAVGETVTHPAKQRVRDDPRTYLSVSTVPTDCMWGALVASRARCGWPCRLFVVEGIGHPLDAEDFPNKRCFSSVRVVEERPAHEVFGPQGEQVVAVLDRATRLTPDEGELLAELESIRATARDVARHSAREAAWYAARYAAWSAARGSAWELVKTAAWWWPEHLAETRRQEGTWCALRDGLRRWGPYYLPFWVVRDRGWNWVWSAARDAMWAFLARDLIAAEQFDALCCSWREVIGEPA